MQQDPDADPRESQHKLVQELEDCERRLTCFVQGYLRERRVQGAGQAPTHMQASTHMQPPSMQPQPLEAALAALSLPTQEALRLAATRLAEHPFASSSAAPTQVEVDRMLESVIQQSSEQLQATAQVLEVLKAIHQKNKST